jgi:hypothetical protein
MENNREARHSFTDLGLSDIAHTAQRVASRRRAVRRTAALRNDPPGIASQRNA